MKKFSYRLESLLKVKAHLEKERQREHAEAVQQAQDQEDKLRDIDDERLGAMDRQRERSTGTLSLAELLVCSRYLLKLKKDTLAGKELLGAYRREAEKRREALVAAARQRKMYEMHKEKKRAAFNEDQESQERKESDEIAVNGYRRKSNV